MKEQMLYNELGEYYDLIYSEKNYAREAEVVKRLIKKHKKSSGNELLDVACGTGRYLSYLKDDYKCIGTDLNKGILDVARKKVKGVEYYQADMIDFNLHKKFDVITCLFSSIGYVKTYENLRSTINNFSAHLKEGGVVIIEPWINKQTFDPKHGAHINVYNNKGLRVVRMGIIRLKGDFSEIDFHYLITDDNTIEHFTDRHVMGLFDVGKTLDYMRESGLSAKYLKKGLIAKDRGLYIGVKK